MQLKNEEILKVNQGLMSLIGQPIKGRLKFKIAKNKMMLEERVLIITKALSLDDQGKLLEDKGNKEILETTQEVEIDLIEEEELEELEISALTLIQIANIIKGDTENDK